VERRHPAPAQRLFGLRFFFGVNELSQAFVMLADWRPASRRNSFVAFPRAVFIILFAALRYALMNGFFAMSTAPAFGSG
jgi:hypothetical protein